ncbi:MAG TPA: UDP-glucose 4-epimerase GalE, partial [Thermomicrobiales bacterium]|nr:UDP-glucose 4-epimerase GalE [Thermomicrobiales bacterium]
MLVTGGAGYIGSIAVERLLDRGHAAVVIDNLWRGHAAAIDPRALFEQADLRNRPAIEAALRRHRPDAVMHFAGATLVPESVREPGLYFEVNVGGSLNLLEAMRAAAIDRIVFSSTAAVYGAPESLPIREDAPTRPVNPYGQSKFAVEQMLAAYETAYGFRYAAFRYFNVAGASERLGEDHEPETHLIPSALLAARGDRPVFDLFGTDYPTPDGTAIRDYVHVLDLADAHIAALERLDQSLGPINLGTTHGFSVRQVVDAVAEVTSRPVPVRLQPRRPGDPPALLADS